MSKVGKVLLPFIAENNIQGFLISESENEDIEKVYTLWKDQQEYLEEHQTLNPINPVKVTHMNEEEVLDFIERYRLANYYPDLNNINLCWFENVGAMIPLRPYYSIQDCMNMKQKLKESQDIYEICANPIEQVPGAFIIHQNGSSSTISFLTQFRDATIKGAAINKTESEEIDVTITIGRSSPFFEVIEFNDRHYVSNGLSRFVSLLEEGYQGKVPGILTTQQSNPNVIRSLYEHAYSTDLVTGDRPPLLIDFLNPKLTYVFKMSTRTKQILIQHQEILLPNEIIK